MDMLNNIHPRIPEDFFGHSGPFFLTIFPRIDTRPTGISLTLWEGSQERPVSHHIPVFGYGSTFGWRLHITTILALLPFESCWPFLVNSICLWWFFLHFMFSLLSLMPYSDSSIWDRSSDVFPLYNYSGIRIMPQWTQVNKKSNPQTFLLQSALL